MTGRPSGTVTFLFTDIEGSTRRWEADPDGMRVALTADDDVLLAHTLEQIDEVNEPARCGDPRLDKEGEWDLQGPPSKHRATFSRGAPHRAKRTAI